MKPAERVKMRHAREIFRLKSSGIATRDIARRIGLALSTVREMLKRGEASGISWPFPPEMNDGALEDSLHQSCRNCCVAGSFNRHGNRFANNFSDLVFNP